MIDRVEFESAMSLLGATYRAPVDKPLIRLYYAVLGERLTTAEFRAAVQLVLATERFWPSPAVLLEAAGKKPRLEERRLDGAEVFTEILAMREWGPIGYTLDLRRVAERYGEAGVRAVRAVGGTGRLRDLTVDAEPHVRRDFATAFATASGIAARERHLELTGADERVRALTADTARALDAERRPKQLPAAS